jgi:F-type H+-transporting ATPase subunit delta
VSARVAAARYARALFDIAIKESSPEQVERELATTTELLKGHPELQKVLTTPGVPAAVKGRVLQVLSDRAGFSAPVRKLLLLLAERDRLTLLPDLFEVFQEQLMERNRVVRAEITTAVPLPADGAAKLEQRLSEATRRRVTISAKVDPSLIGGVVARIGSTVYDGSVATQLTKLRDRLAEQR